MNYLLISILIGAFFMLSILIGLVVGLKYGQKIQRGESIELPNLNPIKAIKQSVEESKEEKKNKEEQEKLNDWIDKLENYDGTVIK